MLRVVMLQVVMLRKAIAAKPDFGRVCSLLNMPSRTTGPCGQGTRLLRAYPLTLWPQEQSSPLGRQDAEERPRWCSGACPKVADSAALGPPGAWANLGVALASGGDIDAAEEPFRDTAWPNASFWQRQSWPPAARCALVLDHGGPFGARVGWAPWAPQICSHTAIQPDPSLSHYHKRC